MGRAWQLFPGPDDVDLCLILARARDTAGRCSNQCRGWGPGETRWDRGDREQFWGQTTVVSPAVEETVSGPTPRLTDQRAGRYPRDLPAPAWHNVPPS